MHVGKRTPSALYVHRGAVRHLPAAARRRIVRAVRAAKAGRYDVVKLHHAGRGVSLLKYPGFDRERNPRLERSWFVAADGSVRAMDFRGRARPPVLHRKHLLLARRSRAL